MAEQVSNWAAVAEPTGGRPDTTVRPTWAHLAVLAAVLGLPLLYRIDVGFDPTDVAVRRAGALGVLAVLVGCQLLGAIWARWAVELLVVAGAAALGFRSVAATLLLAVVLAELGRRLLAPTTGGGRDRVDHASLGLVTVSCVVAAGGRVTSPVVGLTLQFAAVVVAATGPGLIVGLGDRVARSARAIVGLRGPVDGDAGPSTGGRAGGLSRVLLSLGVLSVLSLPTLLRPPVEGDLLGPPAQQLLTVAAAVVLTVAYLSARPTLRWSVYLCTLAALELTGCRTVALPIGLGLLVVEAARPVVAPSPTGGRSSTAAGALLGLGVAVGFLGRHVPFPIQLTVLAVLGALLWLRPRTLSDLGRLVGLLASGIAGVLMAVVSSVVWLLFVLLPWGFERIAGWDPTFAPRPAGTRLVPRHVQWTDDRRSWIATTSLTRTRRGWTAALRLLGAAALAGAVLLVFAVQVGAPWYWRNHSGITDRPAMADSPWWPEAVGPETAAFEQGRLSAFLGVELADVASETTNVVDGRRVTWQPPVPPVATVWMFGGSTMFGLGQRDDHTIASNVAKDAWAAGLPIEVVNFGVHGDVHWMETNRLRAALAGGLPPPDVVVFYDGWNDLKSHGPETQDSVGLPFLGTTDEALRGRRVQGSWFSDLFAQGEFTVTTRPAGSTSQEEALRRSIEQYRSAVADTRALTAARGLPVFLFLQPLLVTRAEPVPGEEDIAGPAAERAAEFTASRPEGVVDLTGVLDQVRTPVFVDDGHTNELGAEVVAAEIFRTIEPQLREVAEP